MASGASVATGVSNNASSVTSNSFTPGATRVLFALAGTNKQTGGPVTPTVTGGSLTWNTVVTRSFDFNNEKVTLYWAVTGGSPGSMSVTADCGGVTHNSMTLAVIEWTDADTTAPVVQNATNGANTGTSGTATLSAFADVDNATFGGIAFSNDPGTVSAGSGFSLLGSLIASGGQRMHREFRTENDTTVDFSWVTSRGWGLVAVEVKAAGGASPINVNPGPLIATFTLPTASVFSEGVQTGRPIVDVTTAGWTATPADETGRLFLHLDETEPSDADFITSPAAPGDSLPCEFIIGPLGTPSSTTAGGTLRIRLQLVEDA